MGKETLLSAARRAHREINYASGGLIGDEALKANITLGRHVEKAFAMENRAAKICMAEDGKAALALLREVFDVEDAAERIS